MSEYGLAVYKDDGFTSAPYEQASYVTSSYTAYNELTDAVGTPIFSTSDSTWMSVGSFYVGANSSYTTSYPIFSGWTIKAFIVYRNDPPPSSEPLAPVVTISGTTVTVAPEPGKTSEAVDVIVLAKNGASSLYTPITPTSETADITASYAYFFTITDDLNTTFQQFGDTPLGFGDPDWGTYYDPASAEHKNYLYLLQDLGMPYLEYYYTP